MKKIFYICSSIVLAIMLSFLFILKIYENRFLIAFKDQIIDKTDINFDFTKIHFSILNNFPYGSFILDDVKIFYSKKNHNDTLLKAEKVSFKINIINLNNSIYEFPQITISDGLININGKLIDTLFSKTNSLTPNSKFLIETKNIKFVRCNVKYRYENSIILTIFIDKSNCSGSFLSNSLSINLNLNIYHLDGNINGLFFKTDDLIAFSTTIIERENDYYSNKGLIYYNSLKFPFSFLYNVKSESLQITSSSKKVEAKYFCQLFFGNLKIPINKGILSFDFLYKINFKNPNNQNLTINYTFNNISLTRYKNLFIQNLEGKTTLTNNFNSNVSEINSFKIKLNGFELAGSSKIKNFPRPQILIDTKLESIGEMSFNDSLKLSGIITGHIKSLIEIDDINKLNFKTLRIYKLNSEFILSNLSFISFDNIKKLSGSLLINDNGLHFKGKGLLFNNSFNGTLDFLDFLKVVYHELPPSPLISLEMDRLNLDSVLLNSTKNIDTKSAINYQLKTKINNLKYKGIDIKDLVMNLKGTRGDFFCDNFSLKAFNGVISGSFTYSKQDINYLSLTGQKIDIETLFKGFNNFGQKTVTNQNISGLLTGKVNLTYKFFNNEKIDTQSIKMVSDIIIENGKLSGISQLKRVSKFLNLHEVDSIHFKTLQNRIEIDHGIIKVPSMEIASNLLTFRLAGQHGFNGEFTYWLKLNLKEILAKKYLLKNNHRLDFEKDKNSGLNLFLKIYGNNESFKVGYDRKSTVEHIKVNFNQEGLLLKSIIKEEFILTKKNGLLEKDSISVIEQNKADSTNNKNQKKSFRIEWDEIDSTKIYNQ